jgi:tRNA (mo5U34)-methyltransferase
MADVRQELEQLGPWYHTIELENGLTTPGRSRVSAKFDQFADQLPADLTGQRVLDLGCNAGGIAVQLARRGARVVGVEASGTYYRQACWVRDRLGLDIEYHNTTVYDIGRLPGTFDIVMFLGLFYHLRYPQLMLDLIATKCDGIMLMNTPVVQSPAGVMELRLPEGLDRVTQTAEPRYNWWFPSPSALARMLSVAGFTDIRKIFGTDTPFISSSKHERNESAFETGTIFYRAACRADGSLPGPMCP